MLFKQVSAPTFKLKRFVYTGKPLKLDDFAFSTLLQRADSVELENIDLMSSKKDLLTISEAQNNLSLLQLDNVNYRGFYSEAKRRTSKIAVKKLVLGKALIDIGNWC